MAECAEELRNKVGEVDTCPEHAETVMFIGAGGYVRRRWDKLILCIITEIQNDAHPDDVEVVIDTDWAGRNYYDRPDLQDKRFRLFRDGILLNTQQWRPLNSGGWELLIPGDIQELGQTFTIVRY